MLLGKTRISPGEVAVADHTPPEDVLARCVLGLMLSERVAAASAGLRRSTALLHACHQALDRDRTPAYLEASDLRTRRLYLRHGYADHGPPIRLPGGPLMYPMWREPRHTPRPSAANADYIPRAPGT